MGVGGHLANPAAQLKAKIRKKFTIIALCTAVVVTSAVLLHVMFSADVSNLTIEILAAVVAVVMVVVSVAVTLHFQVEYEAEKEFKTEVFKEKLQKYYELLATFSKADDDDVISSDELNEMKNLARSVALIAHPDVVVTLSNFLENVERFQKFYIREDELSNEVRSELKGTFRNLVIRMRTDLEVVDQLRKNEVEQAIGKLVAPTKRMDENTDIAVSASRSD